MSKGPLVECVPNVSEGRDEAKIEELAAVVGAVEGVRLLDRHTDPDHNRTVFTLAASPEAVVEAGVRLAGKAAELIDLNRHRGVHPRIGALDVLPFVPLRRISLEECAGLAVRAGERIWREHRIPVYLYGAAARRPERRRLAEIRRGGFEALREAAARDPERAPDIGGPGLHPTAGATAAGARKIMIAYNVLLETPDVTVAGRIARRIRASSGGLPEVQAMGVYLPRRGLAQVSMNLLDYEATPVHEVFRAVAGEAEREGVAVRSSEGGGLIPRRALEMAEAEGVDLKWENLRPDAVLEERLKACGLQ